MLVAHRGGRSTLASVALVVGGTTAFGDWRIDSAVGEEAPPAMPLSSGWMVADAERVGPLRVEAAALHPEAVRLLPEAAGDPGHHPVVVAASGPVWIPGVARLGLGWVDSATDRYLVLRTRIDRTWQRYEP